MPASVEIITSKIGIAGIAEIAGIAGITGILGLASGEFRQKTGLRSRVLFVTNAGLLK